MNILPAWSIIIIQLHVIGEITILNIIHEYELTKQYERLCNIVYMELNFITTVYQYPS